jgi:hypothetical protein
MEFAPCSVVETGRRFRRSYWLNHQGRQCPDETSVSFYETTHRKVSEDIYLHSRSRKDLKSHLI